MNTVTRRIAILTAVAAVAAPCVATTAGATVTKPVGATKATVALLNGRITASHPGILGNRAVVRTRAVTVGRGNPMPRVGWTWATRPANGVARIAITATGFADDSVRGERRILNIRRVRPGVWRLDSATIARICDRGVTTDGRLCL